MQVESRRNIIQLFAAAGAAASKEQQQQINSRSISSKSTNISSNITINIYSRIS
jgi:hypothetical protein